MSTLRCKKCPEGTIFKTISELRRHQWATHKDSFKKLFESGKSKLVKNNIIKCELCKKIFESKPQLYHHRYSIHGKEVGRYKKEKTLTLAAQNGHKEMTARELLSQFKIQQTFLNDMVTLMERTIESHDKQTIRNA